MADIFQYSPLRARAENLDQRAAVGSEFEKGARAAWYGMGSSLQNLAGGIGEAVGADNFARDRYLAAQELAREAAITGPRVRSLRQLRDEGVTLSNVGDYAAGVLGGASVSLAPAVAAGALTPVAWGVRGALATGAAAYTPLETGDVIGRMREESGGTPMTGSDLVRAGITGAGSAALQAIPGAIVGGKVAGKAVGDVLGKAPAALTLKQAAARNLWEVPAEGVSEGLGEAVKQIGSGQKLDLGQIGENVVAGAIGGAGLSGVGTVADYARSNVGAVRNKLDEGMDAARRMLKPQTPNDGSGGGSVTDVAPVESAWNKFTTLSKNAWEGIKESDLGKSINERVVNTRQRLADIINDPETPEAIKAKAQEVVDRVGERSTQLWAAAVDKYRNTQQQIKESGLRDTARNEWRKVADSLEKGIDLVDQKIMANATTAQAAEMLKSGAQKAADFAKGMAEDIQQRMNVSPETKARVAEAMQNLGDKANQAFIASKWKAIDAKDALVSRLKSLKQRLDEHMKKSGEDSANTRRSMEDYDRVRALIAEGLRPHASRINEELGDDPEALNTLGDSLRTYLESITSSQPDDKTVLDREWARLQISSLLGGQSAEVIGDLVSKLNLSGNRAVAEQVFREANELARVDASLRGVRDVIARYAPPDTPSAEIRELETRLVDWASGELTRGKGREEARFIDTQIRNAVEQQFGRTGAKAIFRKLEALTSKNAEKLVQGSEITANRAVWSDDFDYADKQSQNEQEATSWVQGGGKRGALLMKRPASDTSDNTAAQLIQRLKAENPDARVEFVSLAEDPSLFEKAESEKAKLQRLRAQLEAELPGPENAEARGKALVEAKEKMLKELQERGLGMIRVTRMPKEGQLTDEDIRRAKFDEGRNKADAPSRLVVRDSDKQDEKVILDAVKLTRQSMARINAERSWTASDDLTPQTRLARAFADAITSLMEKYGKFKVDPELVIGYVNGQPVTAREALKFDKRTARDVEHDKMRDDLEKLRAEYQRAKAAKDKEWMAEIRREAREILGKMEAEKAAEILHGDNRGDKVTTYRNEDGEVVTQVERDTEGSLTRNEALLIEEGRQDVSMDDNIHRWLVGKPSKDKEPIYAGGGKKKTGQELMKERTRDTAPSEKADVRVDAAGEALASSRLNAPKWYKPEQIKGLLAKGSAIAGSQNAITAKIGNRLMTLAINAHMMSEADYRKLVGTLTATAPSEISGVVNELARKYADRILPPKGKDDVSKASPTNSLRKDLPTPEAEYEQRMGGQPDPKVVAAKKAAFLEKAASGDKALIKELKASDDVKGLQRALKALNDAGVAPDVAQIIHDRLAELIKDPQNAYDAQTLKYSREQVDTDLKVSGQAMPVDGKKILEYIDKVLGSYVQVEFANLGYSGEFTETEVGDVIRVSIHSLNPMSVAYHESLHAFFKLLREKKLNDVIDPILKAVSTPFVMSQLQQRLNAKGSAAVAQLRDPEERAAYAFQFFMSDPTFKLRPETKTVMQRIADFFKRLLGIVSNDAQALAIFEYFASGQFKQRMEASQTRLIYKELVEANRSKALETAKALTKPLTNLADSVVGAGAQRLRDTNIPALVELANMTKPELGADYKDPGFIAAARLARSRWLSKLMDIVNEYGGDNVDAAHQMLISGKPAEKAEQRLMARAVQKLLREMYDTYLKPNIKDLGDRGEKYFPRVWDSYYISQHMDEFKALLAKYGYEPKIAETIAADASANYLHETNRPGMEAALVRKLDEIPAEEAAPFVVQDFFQVMDLYMTQATRRVEWAKRFGSNNETLEQLLKRATSEGATPEQIELAREYARGVNGTLGDDLDPTARRWIGNILVYQNLRLLPLAIFSSIVDPLGIVVRGGTLKDALDTYKRGLRELPKSWRKNSAYDYETELAETLGVIDHVALSDFMAQQFTQGMVGGTAKRINDALFKYNFMEGWNRSVRVQATQAAMRFIVRHATKPTKDSERFLAELGLKPSDVKIVDGRLAVLPSDGLSVQEANRMRIAINKWVDGAVLRPDAADRPIWMNDPHWALFAHFKNFVFAFHHTILKRVWHEIQHGNYAPAMALAGYVPVMIAADIAKDMLTHGFDEPEWKRDWTTADYVAYGIERAGLLGVGQFAVDMYQDVKLGGMGLGALGGPTVDQLADAIQVVGGVREFEPFALRSLPANALYRGWVDDDE